MGLDIVFAVVVLLLAGILIYMGKRISDVYIEFGKNNNKSPVNMAEIYGIVFEAMNDAMKREKDRFRKPPKMPSAEPKIEPQLMDTLQNLNQQAAEPLENDEISKWYQAIKSTIEGGE